MCAGYEPYHGYELEVTNEHDSERELYGKEYVDRLAMMMVTPYNGYDPFCGYKPSGGYAAFGGYERVWCGYERGYERIWNPWWLWLTINTPKESANGESTWGDVETKLNWSSSNSLYVRCIAMGDWVRGSARGLPVVRSQWD